MTGVRRSIRRRPLKGTTAGGPVLGAGGGAGPCATRASADRAPMAIQQGVDPDAGAAVQGIGVPWEYALKRA